MKIFKVLSNILKHYYFPLLPYFNDIDTNGELDIYYVDHNIHKYNLTADMFRDNGGINTTVDGKYYTGIINVFPSDSIDKNKMYDYSYIIFNSRYNLFLSDQGNFTEKLHLFNIDS